MSASALGEAEGGGVAEEVLGSITSVIWSKQRHPTEFDDVRTEDMSWNTTYPLVEEGANINMDELGMRL